MQPRGGATDDVLVVGARCAGAATGMLLARAGLAVRLVERAPRLGDVVSGHLIKPSGTARLRDWGLLDTLLDRGTPAVTERVLWVDGQPRVAPPAETPVLAPRRPLLDSVLLEAARDAGAAVDLATPVTGVLREGGRIVGVETADGDRCARLVVGADGRHSRIARSVAAAYTFHEPPATFAYYSYWRGLDVTQVHAWLETGLFLGLIPTDDDLTLVFYQAPAARFEDARRDPVEAYLRTLHSRPQIRELLQRGALAERLRGSRDLPTFFRRSAGPGWALAGDAGHHKDPLIARGIADAFRDADLLARHVLDGWDADLDSALRRYERDRNGVAAPLAAANSALARLDSTSSSLALRWQQAAALEARLDAVQPGGAESSTPVPSGTVS